MDNLAAPIKDVSVTFSLANPTGATRINGVAAPPPVKTDANGKASVTITRAPGNVCPVVVGFVRGTEYPQTTTVPVVIQ